ncbi:MAG: hypothetical protein IJY74_01985, partial [Oscillospiraceae bacterium]|nr:hypothetical protein [Oscillospiraceae bacterium]
QQHSQQMAASRQAADAVAADKRLESELRKEELKAQNAAIKEQGEIQAQIRKWNAEIDQMISEQEDARRDKLVESIKRYQIDLANASRDIVNSIGLMSLELREKAHNMVLEKTKEYKAIQDEAKKQSMLELKEAKDMFFIDDPDTYAMLRDHIFEERSTMVDMAGRFITELSEDIKRLNENCDYLMREGMKNVNANLKPLANALNVEAKIGNTDDVKRIEDGSVIEAEAIEV